jgi:hypothetical protein
MTRAILLVCLTCSALAACNNGSSGDNSAALVVNAGPAKEYVNGLFTSVTVCAPGTSSCQTLDGVLVDTGSSGLRVLSSALTLALQKETNDQGLDIAGCALFADGSYTWGKVVLADVKLSGETASSVPIQVIQDPSSQDFAQAPQDCTGGGGTNAGTLASLGANGILGVSSFRFDCGQACVVDTSPGMYFGCGASGCQAITVVESKQLPNPVYKFASDNNGVVIDLPMVSASGAATLSGTLTFGIGTQSDNSLGSATVLLQDLYGNVTTQFKGNAYDQSFIDSGSNGIFFLDPASSGLSACPGAQFYCPASPQQLSASLQGTDGRSAQVSFGVADESACMNASMTACGSLAGASSGDIFLWGLPFFYGRRVFTAIEGQTTPSGPGQREPRRRSARTAPSRASSAGPCPAAPQPQPEPPLDEPASPSTAPSVALGVEASG